MNIYIEGLKARYEKMRKICLRYGNLHHESKSVCHQSIGGIRGIEGIAFPLAELVDNMYLAIEQLQAEVDRLESEIAKPRECASCGAGYHGAGTAGTGGSGGRTHFEGTGGAGSISRL